MPAAPLFYTPIMQAQIRSIPVGKSTLGAIEDAQLRFSRTDGPNGPSLVPETPGAQQAAQGEQALQVAGTVSNIMGLVDGRKGAQLTRVTFAADDDAFVVNRTRTYLDDHPQLLDNADYEGGMRAVAGIMDQVKAQTGKEVDYVKGNNGRGSLDLGPGVTGLLQKTWGADATLAPTEAASLAFHIGKAAELAVAPPDDGSPAAQRLGWLQQASAETLATLPGAMNATAKKLGLVTDYAAFDKVDARKMAMTVSDNAASNVALDGLLRMAGVPVDTPDALPMARQLLKGQPLGDVPNSLANQIVASRQLPPDRADWVAGRIIETEGHPGNVDGLAAQLELAAMKSAPAKNPGTVPPDPAPKEPAPAGPPPVAPGEGEQLPAAAQAAAEAEAAAQAAAQAAAAGGTAGA